MHRLLILSALVVSVASAVADPTGKEKLATVPSKVPPALVILKTHGNTDQKPHPSPGVYTAAPYSMLVVVPETIDPGMVHEVGDPSRSKMPIMKPELHLDKQ